MTSPALFTCGLHLRPSLEPQALLASTAAELPFHAGNSVSTHSARKSRVLLRCSAVLLTAEWVHVGTDTGRGALPASCADHLPERGLKSLLGKDTPSSLKRGYVGRRQPSPLIRQVATSPPWQKSQHHTDMDDRRTTVWTTSQGRAHAQTWPQRARYLVPLHPSLAVVHLGAGHTGTKRPRA